MSMQPPHLHIAEKSLGEAIAWKCSQCGQVFSLRNGRSKQELVEEFRCHVSEQHEPKARRKSA
jgi:hypothetical protein